jgi:hypothetical protein
MIAAGLPEQRIDRFRRCGSGAWVLRSHDRPDVFRIVADYCHDRWCVPCCTARARDLQRAAVHALELSRPRFLTLTLKHSQQPLAVQVTKIWKSFRKLRGYKDFRWRVNGGIAFLEIKWQPVAKRWHPHLHVLVTGSYFPQGDLSRLWLKATGDSHVVDIRAVANLRLAAGYVAKYAAKAWDWGVLSDPDALSEALHALHGRRLYLQFGDCKFDPDPGYDPTETWDSVCRLADLIDAASHGQERACAILTALARSNPCPKQTPGAFG